MLEHNTTDVSFGLHARRTNGTPRVLSRVTTKGERAPFKYGSFQWERISFEVQRGARQCSEYALSRLLLSPQVSHLNPRLACLL